MSNKGWIKLYRSLQDGYFWLNEPFSKGQAWVDLLLLANHRNKKMIFNGSQIIVERGQFLSSILALSQRWKWSQGKCSKFLNLLEEEKMIIQKRKNKGTLINIVNYDIYQQNNIEECEQNENRMRTECEQNENRMRTECEQNATNKNIKNDKNVKNLNNIYIDSKESIRTTSKSVERFQMIVDAWNQLEPFGIKPIRSIKSGSQRCTWLMARLKSYTEVELLEAIENVKHSDFLQGKGKKGWVITFDWFIRPNNFPKVLEGNYSDRNIKQEIAEIKAEVVEKTKPWDSMTDDELEDFKDFCRAHDCWISKESYAEYMEAGS